MTEFMMIFRHTPNPDYKPSPEDMQEVIKKWQDWIGGIAAAGKFESTNQLNHAGKTLHADGVVTDGPYAEVKEIVGGYIIVKTDSLDDAMEIGKGCPILAVGGSVEIRDFVQMNL